VERGEEVVNTSYFSKYRGDMGVSISRMAPYGFKGRYFTALAPSWDLLNKYKQDGDVESYTKIYTEEVLDSLDPELVYKSLGEDAVLLCWEAPSKFCHRHLVAKWLEGKLGIEILEL
jgi:uncharacterized protein (DUF488 family)